MNKECSQCTNKKYSLLCKVCIRSNALIGDYFDPIKVSCDNVIKVDFVNKQIIKETK